MKKFIFYIILFIITVNSAFSQKIYPYNSGKFIDSALNVMNLRYSDFWIPPDMVEDDIHRLQIVKRCFEKPFLTVDFVDSYTKSLINLEPEYMDKLITKIISDLEFSQFKLFKFDDNYPINYINNHLNTKIDSLAGFIASLVIRDYVPIIIQTSSILENDVLYRNDSRSNTLFEYADSLIFFDNFSNEVNVFEHKAKELAFFEKSKDFFAHLNILESTKLFEMGVSLYKEVHTKIKDNLKIKKMLSDSIKTTIIDTDFGKIAIGGREDNVYKGNFIFILDIGGNDTYILPDYKKDEAKFYPVRLIIDFDGNDNYIGGNYSIAGSYKSINILFDLQGDDKYNGGNVSLGGSILGFSVLHDFNGNDYYKSSNLSQGAGAYGIGLLIDKNGDDIYNCQTMSQGFGFVRGFGALADSEGDDSYFSTSTIIDNIRSDDRKLSFCQGTSLGYRPVASGGIGILAEGNGNDVYISDMYGQGSSYWFGIGGLTDFNGDDTYIANQYAQGAGVHYSFGTLSDLNGNDNYISKSVSQGSGHDFAFGTLFDMNGNDKYVAEELSMGAGNANGLSLLFDRTGDDTYSVKNLKNTLGYSDFRRNWSMLGVFIDGSGNDNYTENKWNNFNSIKSYLGTFIDLDSPTEDTKKELKRELITTPIAESLDSLFIQATASLSRFQTGVSPSRAKIVSYGKKGFDYLIKKFNTVFPRERNAIEDMVNKMYLKESDYISSVLMDSLLSADFNVYSMSARILGNNKEKKSLPQMMLRARSANWKDRALAIQHIGELGIPQLSDSIAFLLFDSHKFVRARAAYALASLFHSDIVGEIAPALADTNQIVRTNAIAGLMRHKPFNFELIKEIFSGNMNEKSLLMFVPLIFETELNEKNWKNLAVIMSKQSLNVRKAFYLELLNNKPKKVKELQKILMKNEDDEDLKKIIGRLYEK